MEKTMDTKKNDLLLLIPFWIFVLGIATYLFFQRNQLSISQRTSYEKKVVVSEKEKLNFKQKLDIEIKSIPLNQILEQNWYNAQIKTVNSFSSEEKLARQVFSSDLLISGIKEYDKKNYKVSLEYVKNSIIAYPSGEYYYYASTAFGKLKNNSDALKSLEIALELKYANKDLVYYNIACNKNLLGNQEEAFSYLEKSINDGYKNVDWINKDIDLLTLRKNPDWETRIIPLIEKIERIYGTIQEPKGMRLRSEPSTSSKQIGFLPDKSKILILDKDSGQEETLYNITDRWLKVALEDKIGWVFGGYVKR